MIKQPIFFYLGFGAMVVGFCFALKTLLLLSNSEKTTGSVSNIESYQSRCGGGKRRRSYPCTKYNAIVSYYSKQGAGPYTLTLSAGSSRSNSSAGGASYSQGQSLPIVYSKSSPSDARHDTLFGVWKWELGSSGVAVLFFFVSLFEPKQKRRGFW